MDTSSFLKNNPEVANGIRKAIKKGRIRNPQYMEEYEKYARRYKNGHGISQIEEHTEAERRIIVQLLYAMDLRDKSPAPLSDAQEFEVIRKYFVEEMTYDEIAEDMGLMERNPSWVARVPAIRIMMDEGLRSPNEGIPRNSRFHDNNREERMLRKKERSYKSKTGRNVKARVSKTRVV